MRKRAEPVRYNAVMTLQMLKRFALIILGTVALALGLFGMAVPVLPTTPFLLLAAFCYMHSSHRLYAWLLGNRLFGPTIRNYMQHRAIRRETRNFAMLFLWASLVISILLVDRRPIRLLLLAIGIGVSWHLATLRTLPAGKTPESAETAEALDEDNSRD